MRFVDSAGWEGVYSLLKKDGFNVRIVQNPTTSLADDVTATRQIIAQANGPVILVGHSYGGVVITETSNDPKVSKLVYITAFAADKGESVASLIANPPPGAQVPPILPPQDGFLLLDRAQPEDAPRLAGAHFADRLVRQAQQTIGVGEQGAPLGRESDGAPLATEQPGAEMLFQLADARRHIGLNAI